MATPEIHDGQEDDFFNCNACDRIDSDEMVQCDCCDSWYHYTCAGEGVTHQISEETWVCTNCVSIQFLENVSSMQSTSRTDNVNMESTNRSHGYQSSHSTVSGISRQSSRMSISHMSPSIYSTPMTDNPNRESTNRFHGYQSQRFSFSRVSPSIYSTPMTDNPNMESTNRFHGCQSSNSSASVSSRISQRISLLNHEMALEQDRLQRTFEIQQRELREKFKRLRVKLESEREEESSERTQSVERWVNENTQRSDPCSNIAMGYQRQSETPVRSVWFPQTAPDVLFYPCGSQQPVNVNYRQTRSNSNFPITNSMRPSQSVSCGINVRPPKYPMFMGQVNNNLTDGRQNCNLLHGTEIPQQNQFIPKDEQTSNQTGTTEGNNVPEVKKDELSSSAPSTGTVSEQAPQIQSIPDSSSSAAPTVDVNVSEQAPQVQSIPDSSSSAAPTFVVNVSEQAQQVQSIQESLSSTALAVPNTSNVQQLDVRQIAARHVLPRDLPKFHGSPTEWPIFISGYESSTTIGGYTNAENLIRLQRCLLGDALDAVRSILLVPENVPNVIETLRMMYGRPDLIIHTLINKIQQNASPRMEKLETIINFALLVRNLCATIRACNMMPHMNNPYLMQEIIEKIPTSLRLQWALHKRTIVNPSLETLGNWLYEVARAASEVVVVTVPPPSTFSSNKKNNSSSGVKQSNTDKGYVADKDFISTHAEEGNKNISTNKPSENEKKKCKICQQDCPSISNCNVFKKFSIHQRWEAVKNKKICSTCLVSHRRFQCQARKQCQIDGCDAWHHNLLHSRKVEKLPDVGKTTQVSSNNTHLIKKQSVIYKIVPIVLYGKSKSFRTFAYLDDGSGLTLLEASVAQFLEIDGIKDELCLRWTSNVQRSEADSMKISIQVSSTQSSERYDMTDVRTVNHLDLPKQTLTSDLVQQYPYLERAKFELYENAVPQILIGLPHSNLMLALETIEGPWQQPVATKTRLGWVVQGGKQTHYNKVIQCMPIDEQPNDFELHKLVKDYFSIESFGVKVPETLPESREAQRARQILESTTIRKNNRFESGLLWRNDNIELPDSYLMAMKRLEYIERKMSKDVKLAETLNGQLKEYETKNYIRKLSPVELQEHRRNIWYLPIFVVTNPKKPLKFRIVWDAAAEVKGISLNSQLLTGPDLMVPLLDILFRFREHAIAIGGDIVEMFHQIVVRESDQHAQRFLWRNGNSDCTPDVYVMQRTTFGATCSPCIAQFVKNKNAMEFIEEFPRAVSSIVKSHYVDDLLDSVETPEEAIQLIHDVKDIHRKAGFEIRGVISNSKQVLEAVGEKDNQIGKNLNLGGEPVDRVLGMYWQTSSDNFTFSLKFSQLTEELISGRRRPTKREVLRTLMTVFDPLGLLSFFLVYIKILLHDIWRSQIGWDEPINDVQFAKWMTWIEMLPSIEKLQIPRYYSVKLSSENKSVELHVFVDASELAYASVAYLRVTDDEGSDCTLVGSKCKVAPQKPMSIPRLELQAGVLGARFMNTISNVHTMTIKRRFIYSDSKTVLCWLKSDTRRYRQFVAYRVGEILETTNLDEWRWISTKKNIADEATKWLKKPNMSSESNWFKGPDFLETDNVNWSTSLNDDEETEEELRFQAAHVEIISPIAPKFENFSKWERLLRTQAYVFRYKRILWEKMYHVTPYSGPLSQPELSEAEKSLFRKAQFDGFGDEVSILRWNRENKDKEMQNVKVESPIYKCSPYMDEDGIIRQHGRIDLVAGVSFNAKRPILLPKKHRLTMLLVEWYHRRFLHRNHDSVINEIMQRFYIPGLRVLLKTVVTQCQLCKNRRTVPVNPSMADLPLARLGVYSKPFSFFGVDYFGPVLVADGRQIKKRWGVLMTCMTTRAVYIEVAPSLNTDSCIMVIRNCMHRMNVEPTDIYSDNGSNFHGMNNELAKEFAKMDPDKMALEFNSPRTNWHFNPPTASHMGGSWERLIQSIKLGLTHILQTRHPSEEVLRNVLIECEHIVNSRPLTFVSVESTASEALTPNHFLHGSNSYISVPIEIKGNEKFLTKSYKMSQQMINHFWNRWIQEYLPTITRRTKWFKNVKPIEVGDVVYIVDANNPRNMWPKGIVTEVYNGSRGQVRSAYVQTATRGYKRPVANLAVLDVRGVATEE